jgi:hypothetical protein
LKYSTIDSLQDLLKISSTKELDAEKDGEEKSLSENNPDPEFVPIEHGIKMSSDPTACPTCGGKTVSRCRCKRCDSTCENGHQWHFCEIHHTVVEGLSDHGQSGCSCKPYNHKTAMERLFDNHNDFIGSLREVGDRIYLHDRNGTKKGYYDKKTNRTYTDGKFIGKGNILNSLLKG